MKRYSYFLVAILAACGRPNEMPAEPVTNALSDTEVAGYSRALAPIDFAFPGDHGPHPEFKHEWWYLTGQVTGDDGRRFGYQFTLFRRALTPRAPDRASAWASNQLYMAHLALTDVLEQRFYHDERYGRGALGLAGVDAEPFQAWLEDWSLRQDTPACRECLHGNLRAASQAFTLQLTVRNQHDPVLHGDRGLSRKGNTPGNASYYYSYPRLATSGTIRLNGKDYRVTGSSWFDHEWSTSALEAGQAGWDWFSLQLSDQTELMLFRLRHRKDPERSLLSGTYIAGDAARSLGRDDFRLRILDYWRSPETSVRYPQKWRILVPSLGYDLTVTPWLADQEMNLGFRYWEGAIRISGRRGNEQVSGNGYMELTGYR